MRRVIQYDSRLFKGLYFVYIRVTSKKRLKRKRSADMNIQIHMADHCNLGCSRCNAFSPLVQECFADVDVIKRDLDRLSELTAGNVGFLTISGGEPLLHDQLPEVLQYAHARFPEQIIKVITNGLLLENAKERFWEICSRNNIIISLTCYPIDINIKRIKEIAVSHDVKLIFQDDTDIRKKTMSFAPLDPAGKQKTLESYRFCFMANNDFVLEDGKLSPCPVIAHIKYFNEYFNQSFAVSEDDYIDIYKVDSFDEVLDFFCKPMPFCRYCKKKERISGLRWEISKKEISEWM